jgi:hypothetical protein
MFANLIGELAVSGLICTLPTTQEIKQLFVCWSLGFFFGNVPAHLSGHFLLGCLVFF